MGVTDEDKRVLEDSVEPREGCYVIEIDSTLKENLIFFIMSSERSREILTNYPRNKIVGFTSKDALGKAIEAFNEGRDDNNIVETSDDGNIIRCSNGNIYEAPIKNYFLMDEFLKFIRKDPVLSKFLKVGYERVPR
jgi:hypothetical protein